MSNILWSDKVNETLAELSGISKDHSAPKPKTVAEVAMEKVHREIAARMQQGLPQQSAGSDPFGYLCGYPVEDLIGTLPLSERYAALMEIIKMTNLSGVVVGGGGGGGGGGVLGQPHYGGPAGPSNPTNPLYDHERMLCMRMRWRNVHDSPFENVYVYAAVGRKVFITIITKDMKAVTLDVDDDGLYPSDHLIAEIRTLGG